MVINELSRFSPSEILVNPDFLDHAAVAKFISEKILEPVNYFGTLTITDIDGEANGGEFKEQTVELKDLKKTIDKSNQDDWYWGVVTFEANITMLKQKDSNE
jgi:hypothetical protein